MGKGILFFSFAFVVGLSLLYMGNMRTSVATAAVQSDYEHRVLARQIAESGFNLVLGRTKKNFETYRPSITEQVYQDGAYSATVSGDANGPVTIAISGTFEQTFHSIDATLSRYKPVALDAVTIDSPMEEVDMEGSYFISGLDTDVGSTTPGSGTSDPVHAILTLFDTAQEDFLEAITAPQVEGSGGTGDVALGSPRIDMDSLAADILTHPSLITYTGNKTFRTSDLIGSAANPAMVLVNGNVKMTDAFVGYGILYVNGTLELEKDARWEGLLYLRDDGGKLKMKNDAAVYGALIARSTPISTSSIDPGLPGGHFDVDVFSGPSTNEDYHEHQYDDKYDVTYVDVLKPGCGSNGGLCWESLVGTGHTTLKATFFNAASSSGTYVFEADGVLQTGASTDAFSTLFTPSTITQFTVTFDALCSLRGTSPSTVQGDITNRDGSFSVRIYAPDIHGYYTDLIYELSVYHHLKSDTTCSASTDESTAIQPMVFEMDNQAAIYASSAALNRLTTLIPRLIPVSDYSLIDVVHGTVLLED